MTLLLYITIIKVFSFFFFYSVHQDKNKKVKVKKETPNTAAVYKFEAKRKRWERNNHHAAKKSPILPMRYW